MTLSMTFLPGRRYRMLVVFGPSISPGSGPTGENPSMSTARTTVAGARLLTKAAMLDRLLPPGFTLEGEPVVTVEFSYLSDLAWLARRGYAIVKVMYPARYLPALPRSARECLGRSRRCRGRPGGGLRGHGGGSRARRHQSASRDAPVAHARLRGGTQRTADAAARDSGGGSAPVRCPLSSGAPTTHV